MWLCLEPCLPPDQCHNILHGQSGGLGAWRTAFVKPFSSLNITPFSSQVEWEGQRDTLPKPSKVDHRECCFVKSKFYFLCNSRKNRDGVGGEVQSLNRSQIRNSRSPPQAHSPTNLSLVDFQTGALPKMGARIQPIVTLNILCHRPSRNG